jgi:lysophospholipase L1-like esterase
MRTIRLMQGAALSAGAVGGISGGTYGLLNSQARQARSIIGGPPGDPLNADGIYTADGAGPVMITEDKPLQFAVFGDSVAAGLGVEAPGELLGVQLAKGLAEEADRPVELTTYAISGSTTRDISAQIDRALERRVELAMMIVGGNDVTSKLRRDASAQLLSEQLSRLVGAGTQVVIGTCPDLGTIRPIPQPLRTFARRYSLRLAALQRSAALAAGATPVALADLLGPEFLARPAELFSADHFHPSAAGYEAAAAVLLAPLCASAGLLGEREAMPVDRPRSAPDTLRTRLGARLSPFVSGVSWSTRSLNAAFQPKKA